MKLLQILILFLVLTSCIGTSNSKSSVSNTPNLVPSRKEASIVILGTVQDAGSPHIACTKDCCSELFLSPDKNRKVTSLGVIDAENNKKYLFEATPDIAEQLKLLKNYMPRSEKETPDGVFLTHAHIGHYSGLMYLGKEAMNAANVAVYAMPKMKTFLEQNGPWSQLVTNNNISIQDLNNQEVLQLTPNIKVVPFRVPHRDEYSETVGYTIVGPNKRALFIPDIDKWEKWEIGIIEAIKNVDYAFIDGTFYDGAEINNRDISEIPHPFIIESMNKFKNLSPYEKRKIHFIHFNHTNPALNPASIKAKQVIENGFNIARINDTFVL